MSREDMIGAVADKMSTHMFITMLNPAHRGQNFRFDTFDIERYVACQAVGSFARPLNTTEVNHLKQVARRAWDNMVRESAVLDWISSQELVNS